MSLKAMIVGRYQTGSTLLQHYCDSDSAMKADASSISSKMKAIGSKPNERDKLKCTYGNWFVQRDRQDIYYAMCVSDNYPERIVYKLVAELQEAKKQALGGVSSTSPPAEQDSKVSKKLKSIAGSISTKYSTPEKADKLAKVQSQVDGLHDELETGIRNLIGNQDDLGKMDSQAQKMKEYAAQFEVQTKVLEQQTGKKKWTLYFIVGGLVGSVIIVIILIIALKKA